MNRKKKKEPDAAPVRHSGRPGRERWHLSTVEKGLSGGGSIGDGKSSIARAKRKGCLTGNMGKEGNLGLHRGGVPELVLQEGWLYQNRKKLFYADRGRGGC